MLPIHHRAVVGEGGIEPLVLPPLSLWTRVLQTPKGDFTRKIGGGEANRTPIFWVQTRRVPVITTPPWWT